MLLFAVFYCLFDRESSCTDSRQGSLMKLMSLLIEHCGCCSIRFLTDLHFAATARICFGQSSRCFVRLLLACRSVSICLLRLSGFCSVRLGLVGLFHPVGTSCTCFSACSDRSASAQFDWGLLVGLFRPWYGLYLFVDLCRFSAYRLSPFSYSLLVGLFRPVGTCCTC